MDRSVELVRCSFHHYLVRLATTVGDYYYVLNADVCIRIFE